MRNFALWSLLSALIFFIGCSDDDKIPEEKKQIVSIEGKVEKGPLIKESLVTIQELNENFTPNGRSFTATISDNEGTFRLDNLEIESDYILLSANGYYYNENRDRLSDGQITLTTVVKVEEKTSANINVLTHLMKDRLIAFLKNGSSYDEAKTTVQRELLANFGLQKYASTDINTFSIADGNDEAGALIVISTTLLSYSYDENSYLIELLASLTEEFEKNGKFTNEQIQDLRERSQRLSLDRITDNIQEKYNNKITIKDLHYYIDWDNDGIAGNEFGEGEERYLRFEIDTLYVGIEGGTFEVKIETNIKYDFGWNISPGYLNYFIQDVDFSYEEIDDNTLKISVEPANSIFMQPGNISIQSFDRNNSASLCIFQEADFSNETIDSEIKQIYAGILYNLVYSTSAAFTAEAYYTNNFPVPFNSNWTAFSNHKLDSDNFMINRMWGFSYQFANVIRQHLHIITERQFYNEIPLLGISNLHALIYYHLETLWGNIPYVDETSESGFKFTQYKAKELFKLFEDDLLKAIELFPAEKNDNLIFVSRDFPRGILANMYMQTKEYQKALSLYQDIIKSNQYGVSSTWDKAFSNGSKELIFSVKNNTDTDYSEHIIASDNIPILTYTEVVLSAAECELKQGNITKAVEYINQVLRARGKNAITNSDVLNSLKNTWKEELKGTFSYFAFLKRNNLAVETLNIQEYQQLFPIPQTEIDYWNVIQNPGY